jgi:hypothetical protein
MALTYLYDVFGLLDDIILYSIALTLVTPQHLLPIGRYSDLDSLERPLPSVDPELACLLRKIFLGAISEGSTQPPRL